MWRCGEGEVKRLRGARVGLRGGRIKGEGVQEGVT
jgi:hypothetical protein